MARKPRRMSISGYLHIILRGNNKQILFEKPDDYRFFISRMARYCREAGIRIIAYCLMENHVHILVHDPENTVSEMMKKLGVSYSKYYNEKYERIGHLFQGRFLSEPVENDEYLLTAYRYILNNPRKAGICPAEKYRWSSYKGYFRNYEILDLDFIREKYPTAEAYREFIHAPNEDECLEFIPPTRDDEWALGMIQEWFGVQSGTELQTWELPRRNSALKLLKEKGLSQRQIERLTGISRKVIKDI